MDVFINDISINRKRGILLINYYWFNYWSMCDCFFTRTISKPSSKSQD